MVDTTHRPALGYMEIVDSRDVATIIQGPGTVIWSDRWAAYNRVSNIP